MVAPPEVLSRNQEAGVMIGQPTVVCTNLWIVVVTGGKPHCPGHSAGTAKIVLSGSHIIGSNSPENAQTPECVGSRIVAVTVTVLGVHTAGQIIFEVVVCGRLQIGVATWHEPTWKRDNAASAVERYLSNIGVVSYSLSGEPQLTSPFAHL